MPDDNPFEFEETRVVPLSDEEAAGLTRKRENRQRKTRLQAECLSAIGCGALMIGIAGYYASGGVWLVFPALLIVLVILGAILILVGVIRLIWVSLLSDTSQGP